MKRTDAVVILGGGCAAFAAFVYVMGVAERAEPPNSVEPNAVSDDAPSAPEPTAPKRRDLTEPETRRVDGDASGKTVNVVFMWPVGGLAELEFAQTGSEDGKTTYAGTSRYSVVVTELADGNRRVELKDPEPVLPADAGAVDRSAVARQMAVPSFLIRQDGQYIGLANEGDFLAKMDRLGAGVHGDAATPQGTHLAHAAAREAVRALWNSLIAPDSDFAWELGRTYDLSGTPGWPLPGGRAVPAKGSATMTGMVPCTVSATDRRCVRFERVITPSPDEWDRGAAATAKSAFPDGGKVDTSVSKTLSVEIRLTLVTEPDGLLPHWLVRESLLERRMKLGGTTRVVRNADRYEARFRYPIRRAP